ncbi:MAG: iron-containing alcohol dehydrogenase, partial [Leptospiraceae bacterium]|nr:iron-containing alcohol dehydrogenase [Leptospiraceae bacterium]
MNISKNVLKYLFGRGAFSQLTSIISDRKNIIPGDALFFVDEYFKNKPLRNGIPVARNDSIVFVNTDHEIDTDLIDKLTENAKSIHGKNLSVIAGIGGGSILDVAKAVSNLYTNGGKAEDYQGWDLVKIPGIYKIGIPTLSGTGAEASRTCVLMNVKKNLKLGMNSEHTIYDQLVLDPDLTITVPNDQFFYTGMDTYIHCIESLNGHHRHVLADAFSREALRLCEEVYFSDDMRSEINREKIMTASYLGGCAIANSFVGVVHPFSAGLSV